MDNDESTTHDGTDNAWPNRGVKDKVRVPRSHATILHLIELHQDGLFVEHNGLTEKLTSVFMAWVV